MAKYSGCGKEMLEANGCGLNVAVYRAKEGTRNVHRVRFGEGKWFEVGFQGAGRCSDCGAKAGSFHYVHCSREECARCGWQLLFCHA